MSRRTDALLERVHPNKRISFYTISSFTVPLQLVGQRSVLRTPDTLIVRLRWGQVHLMSNGDRHPSTQYDDQTKQLKQKL